MATINKRNLKLGLTVKDVEGYEWKVIKIEPERGKKCPRRFDVYCEELGVIAENDTRCIDYMLGFKKNFYHRTDWN